MKLTLNGNSPEIRKLERAEGFGQPAGHSFLPANGEGRGTARGFEPRSSRTQ